MDNITNLHVVLVSENVPSIEKGSTSASRTREMTDDRVTNEILDALKQLCKHVDVCNSPADLVQFSGKDVLVLTVYGGAVSRNRMSLVPAVCESLGLKYAGADAYARFLCQDKNLTKNFVAEFGMDTPDSVILRSSSDIDNIESLQLPLVIKPNLEGSSIGIDDRNLTRTYLEAKELAAELLEKFNQPVLVEEFCSGPEVCICVVGHGSEIIHFEAVEDVHETDPNFLHDRLFTASLKRGVEAKIGHRLITDRISSSDADIIKNLFLSLGKIDYLRVDCRLNNGKCSLIELTPDPFMSINGSFGNSWRMSGTPYIQGVKMLLETALRNY